MLRADQTLADLPALMLRGRLEKAETSAPEVAAACLDRIAAEDGTVGAFAFSDRAHVLAQAEEAEARRKSGRPIGPLNGIPVAIKDVIDTEDMPTERGTPLDAGRKPRHSASVVNRLKAAGAVVIGKTVTAELAFLTPGKTRNPRDKNRTPGGSSSGSAAAVAANMVPLAIGTQTNGSVIRPASFCGVVGFKPSFGLISRTGILPLAPPLDTVGVFARTIEDAALLTDAIAGGEEGDPDSTFAAAPRLLETALSKPPVKPDFAFVRSPAWDKAAAETKEGFEELAGVLGERCKAMDLPETYGECFKTLRTIMLAGMAHNLKRYEERGAEQLSPGLREALAEGRSVAAADYLAALDWRTAAAASLDQAFERYDALITPAAVGEAPLGLQSTGDPSFCTLWTLAGLPAVTLPLLEGPNGLPVGVQLIGRHGYDGRLLRTARWLMDFLANHDRTNTAADLATSGGRP